MIRARRFAIASTGLVFLWVSAGCAQLMGNLRRDLDDSPPAVEPTVGGLWPEGGQLEDPGSGYEYRGAVGHAERAPAGWSPSAMSGAARERNSWIDPAQQEREWRASGDSALPSYQENPNLAPAIKRQYQDGGNRVTREDFIDRAPNEGSLWASNGQTNYLFTKNRVRSVGDLITLTVEQPLIKDIATELKKNLTGPEMELEVADAQKKIIQDAVKSKAGTGTARAPAKAEGEKTEEAEAPAVREATPSDVDLTPTLGINAGESMMVEILERFPNGNYKIRGTKRVPYRGSTRLMTLVGVAKGSDIDDAETVASGKLYEYRLKIFR